MPVAASSRQMRIAQTPHLQFRAIGAGANTPPQLDPEERLHQLTELVLW